MILNYVYGYDDVVAQFAAQLIPACRGRGFGNCKTIGVVEGDMLIAALVYHNYDPDAETIEISSAALPGHYWMTRETIKRMYQYPFLGCRCQMVFSRVEADNAPLIFMFDRFGYEFVRVPRGMGRRKDGMLCLLTREAWEANKFNQRWQHHLGVEPQYEEAAE
jgi:hypothetical protein